MRWWKCWGDRLEMWSFGGTNWNYRAFLGWKRRVFGGQVENIVFLGWTRRVFGGQVGNIVFLTWNVVFWEKNWKMSCFWGTNVGLFGGQVGNIKFLVQNWDSYAVYEVCVIIVLKIEEFLKDAFHLNFLSYMFFQKIFLSQNFIF